MRTFCWPCGSTIPSLERVSEAQHFRVVASCNSQGSPLSSMYLSRLGCRHPQCRRTMSLLAGLSARAVISGRGSQAKSMSVPCKKKDTDEGPRLQ